MHELLTPVQMSKADALAVEGGTPGIELMENAGKAVFQAITDQFSSADNILIVCGTGNNGGDGFIVARLLADIGSNAQVFVCGDITKISGDAELALARLDKGMLVNDRPDFSTFDLIVDALFGAGLDREIKGEYAEIIHQINQSANPIISIDLPSGIDGRTGRVLGCAVEASSTTTFFRYKPGHCLLPGRKHCGKLNLHQIGIEPDVLMKTGSVGFLNRPALWRDAYPLPDEDKHKYHRGHTLVISGPPTATGAARLVAQAALRSGSGLVTMASPEDALRINACHLTSVMLQQANTPTDVKRILKDTRFTCVALGPGMPPNKQTRNMVLKVLEMNRRTVLDAGALTAFSGDPSELFSAIKRSEGDVFMTPHEGEFSKLFANEMELSSKLDRATIATQKSGATIVFKGADTVVATPTGQVSIANNAPPWLATAGSGDVLTGIIAGLAAQNMPTFEAACAAVWLHGDTANRLGPGIISSDLDDGLRQAVKAIILKDF